MKHLITDIQRFSLNDGPGIRTTVFFKGCNMHCTWCHNPETLSFEQDLMFYPSKCIGCGKCAKNCPVDAITRTDYIAPGHKLASFTIDTDKCVKCGVCVGNCKFKAVIK